MDGNNRGNRQHTVSATGTYARSIGRIAMGTRRIAGSLCKINGSLIRSQALDCDCWERPTATVV